MWPWLLRAARLIGIPIATRYGPRAWQALVHRVRGEVYWIVGPPGAGKTTLLATLAGRPPPIGQTNPTRAPQAVAAGHHPALGTYVRPSVDLAGERAHRDGWRAALTAEVSQMVFVCDPTGAAPDDFDDAITAVILDAFDDARDAIDHAYRSETRPAAETLRVYFNKADRWLDAPTVDDEPAVVATLRRRLTERFRPSAAEHGITLRFGWGSLAEGEGWARHRRHVFGR